MAQACEEACIRTARHQHGPAWKGPIPRTRGIASQACNTTLLCAYPSPRNHPSRPPAPCPSVSFMAHACMHVPRRSLLAISAEASFGRLAALSKHPVRARQSSARRWQESSDGTRHHQATQKLPQECHSFFLVSRPPLSLLLRFRSDSHACRVLSLCVEIGGCGVWVCRLGYGNSYVSRVKQVAFFYACV